MTSNEVIILIFVTLVFSFIVDHRVEGKRIGRKEEAGKQKISATAETTYGEIYDCIDIDKQSAFEHPALKGHKVQIGREMEFAHILSERSSLQGRNNNSNNHYENIWLEKSCPYGTVPIPQNNSKRRARYPSPKFQNSSLNWNGGFDFAGIRVNSGDPGRKFTAASASINIYAPDVAPYQFSAATIFIESGQDQIQAGWAVNIELNGDKSVRLYTSWTRDNFASTGCYNTKCPGFVIVNTEFPVNYAFPSTSKETGKVDVNILIEQTTTDGSWLLSMDSQTIGFWPPSLFTSLNSGADTIRFGGQVYTQPGHDDSPPMGSGGFYGGNKPKTCYMHHVLVSDDSATLRAPDSFPVDHIDSRCYYEGYDSNSPSDDGYSFLFGGAGGKAGVVCLWKDAQHVK